MTLVSDETMTSLSTNGVAPATPDTVDVFFTTSSYSVKSEPYFSTSRWALAPKILLRRSEEKPFITLITTTIAIVPTATASTEMTVMVPTTSPPLPIRNRRPMKPSYPQPVSRPPSPQNKKPSEPPMMRASPRMSRPESRMMAK